MILKESKVWRIKGGEDSMCDHQLEEIDQFKMIDEEGEYIVVHYQCKVCGIILEEVK